MIYIGLGANLPGRFGGPEETIHRAYEQLESRGIKVVKKSNIWFTAPVPYDPDQPWYRNSVVAVSTQKTPITLMQILLEIEEKFGRIRTYKNAPRTLDLDLLAYDSLCANTPDLIVPHERMHQRAFVLNPLKEIEPDWIHPVTGEHIDNLLSKIPYEQQAELRSSEKSFASAE